MTSASLLALALLAAAARAQQATSYGITDAAGPARALDGVGGLSGGGATSVFLPSYDPAVRAQIYDYLFKPNFGASLQILKVEIGGDAQSTDGSESSHMHNPWEENYGRGYEWELLVEAKKRNPNITLYGLAWAYPQWVTCQVGTLANCTDSIYSYPEQTARYITKWVAGAKNTYGVDIDYIGSWNERPYNTTYLKALRVTLDNAGFSNTKIAAPDSGWDIAKDMLADPVLYDAIGAIGAHYPGTHSSPEAEQTMKPLWASEDDSTYANTVGAQCWARVINNNYVEGIMTASINWNLVSAYMKGTNWYRAGIFNAFNPWSGSYGSFNADGSWTVGPMVWASAHTTQFSAPHSWSYLLVDPARGGAGKLKNGGSYVTLKNFATGDFSIVVEKMSRDHSSCVRPGLPGYATSDEAATFTLSGALASVTSLNVWYTHWAYYPGDKTVEFEQLAPVAVVNGVFTLNVTVDSLYTLTTLSTGSKGSFGAPPPLPTLFPAAHTDDFEACPFSKEGSYFTDQNGVWECVPSNDPAHGTVMRQMVPLRPVTWGGDIRPHSLIGHRDGKDSSIVFDAYIEEPGASVMLGLRMQGTDNSQGILFAVDTTSTWGVWKQISDVGGAPIASGTSPVAVAAGQWHTYRGDVNGSLLNVWIDGTPVIVNWNTSAHGLTTSGHALIGCKNYGEFTQFDNFQLYTRYTTCGGGALVAGAPVGVVACAAEVGVVPGSQWVFTAVPNAPGSNSTIALASNPSLCVGTDANSMLVLVNCNAADATQLWSWSFDGIAPDGERSSSIKSVASGKCLDIFGEVPDVGAQMDSYSCSGRGNQAFFMDFTAGEIANEATSTCLGVC